MGGAVFVGGLPAGDSDNERSDPFEPLEHNRMPAAPASWKKCLRVKSTVSSVTAVPCSRGIFSVDDGMEGSYDIRHNAAWFLIRQLGSAIGRVEQQTRTISVREDPGKPQ